MEGGLVSPNQVLGRPRQRQGRRAEISGADGAKIRFGFILKDNKALEGWSRGGEDLTSKGPLWWYHGNRLCGQGGVRGDCYKVQAEMPVTWTRLGSHVTGVVGS